ncbi:hypothetical protein F5Y17DRAFT_42548 [Xylariaceae sp. FL0594]|nr:hypothetical protein F5Y17DRAFT_42548 [Xylariaceae sp. FL0594]
METSAPKRRKTSPTTSVPTDGFNEPASSDSATRRSSRLNRPSFASPTKASLARSNPDVLQRRVSQRSSPVKDSPSVRVSSQAPAASEPGSQHSENDGRDVAEAPAEGATTPSRIAGGGTYRKSGRSPIKPSPRPLPPPSAEEEELIDPFKGRRLRRSPPPGVLPRVEPEEPELPPTPTQKGLSDPSSIVTSPAGIHNTPSKRPRRSRALAAKMNSSPLKQPPLRPPEFGTETVEKAPILRLNREPLKNEPRRKRKKRLSHPSREIEEVDPLADKKALRDSLLAEVAQLEQDLKVTSRENERVYRSQRSRRSGIELPSPEQQSRLFDVMSRHVLPPAKEEAPDTMQDWLEAAMNPIAFLPFGQGGVTALPPFVMPSPESNKEADTPMPVSHHPISMTAEEELPYLQLFTPLTFTSSVTTLQLDDSGADEVLLQRHAISVASSPPGLFAAAIDMTVNTKTLSVTDLAVPRLDPSAASELGPFLEKHMRGDGNGAVTRNVSIMAWAMGEWVRLATRRAHFWYAVEHELGSSEGLVRCASHMRRSTRKRPGRPYNRDDDAEDDDDAGGVGGPGLPKRKGLPSKADLVALMGRTSQNIDLSSVAGAKDEEDDGGVLTALVQWRIEFDWTGEGRSKIGLLLKAPAKWRANDGKQSLAGLPEMFDKLLQESKDPLQAVKVVVALVVGDG